LDYELESDELDLLIDVEAPVPAEVVPLDAGVYIRRERGSGRVVGAFVRGYSHVIRQLHAGEPMPMDGARVAGLVHEFQEIVTWLTETVDLSDRLVRHLKVLPEQGDMVEDLLKVHASVMAET
jgi:hypothetical protein